MGTPVNRRTFDSATLSDAERESCIQGILGVGRVVFKGRDRDFVVWKLSRSLGVSRRRP